MSRQNDGQGKECSNNASTELRITNVEQIKDRVALTVNGSRVIHIRDLTDFPPKYKSK
jgi:hypothetical protein